MPAVMQAKTLHAFTNRLTVSLHVMVTHTWQQIMEQKDRLQAIYAMLHATHEPDSVCCQSTAWHAAMVSSKLHAS